eukprot:1179302-Prorocentrum_minimum.AAC.2
MSIVTIYGRDCLLVGISHAYIYRWGCACCSRPSGESRRKSKRESTLSNNSVDARRSASYGRSAFYGNQTMTRLMLKESATATEGKRKRPSMTEMATWRKRARKIEKSKTFVEIIFFAVILNSVYMIVELELEADAPIPHFTA